MFPKKHLNQHVFQAVLKSRLCMKGTSRILCSRGILAFIVALWASSMKVSMCIRFVSANFRRFCWRPPGRSTRLATFKKGFLRLAPHGQSDQSPLREGKKGEREERKRKERKERGEKKEERGEREDITR